MSAAEALGALGALGTTGALASLAALEAEISQYDQLVVAYSGGVDSAVVAAVAHKVLGSRALLATAVSPSLPLRERRAARELALSRGWAHIEVATAEGEDPSYRANGPDRCYFCKSALFDALRPIAAALGAAMALGTNADDVRGHRPGHRAAVEQGAVAPLLDAGLGKEDVRAIAAALGLPVAEKPAAACLASRVEYGDEVTEELLVRIERAEDTLLGLGLAECRVRAHSRGTVARIEAPASSGDLVWAKREQIERALRAEGFAFVALDLAPFKSGRMNRTLPLTPVSHA